MSCYCMKRLLQTPCDTWFLISLWFIWYRLMNLFEVVETRFSLHELVRPASKHELQTLLSASFEADAFIHSSLWFGSVCLFCGLFSEPTSSWILVKCSTTEICHQVKCLYVSEQERERQWSPASYISCWLMPKKSTWDWRDGSSNKVTRYSPDDRNLTSKIISWKESTHSTYALWHTHAPRQKVSNCSQLESNSNSTCC